MAVKLIADVHSAIGGIGDRVGPEDTLLVLGDVLGLIDWADFTGILPEVIGRDRLREMLFQAFAAGEEAARNLKNILLSPENEYFDSLRERVEGDYRDFRRAVEDAGCRTLVLFGNSDIPDAMQEVFDGSDVVEMAEGTKDMGGQVFGFLPGSVTSPFDMPGESDDEYIRGRLMGLGKVDVLCAHIPPSMEELTFDVVAGRNVLGSTAMLDYIREHQPGYVYHGHVHQPAQRTFEIGSTTLVNVGYYKRQRYVHIHGE